MPGLPAAVKSGRISGKSHSVGFRAHRELERLREPEACFFGCARNHLRRTGHAFYGLMGASRSSTCARAVAFELQLERARQGLLSRVPCGHRAGVEQASRNGVAACSHDVRHAAVIARCAAPNARRGKERIEMRRLNACRWTEVSTKAAYRTASAWNPTVL